MSGVVEGVDGRSGLEVQVGRPIDPLQEVAEELGNIVDIECGVVFAGDDRRYFASESCPWPRIALATVRISCGRRTLTSGM